MAEREGEYRLRVTQDGAEAFDQVEGGIDGARAAAESAEPALERMGETLADAPKEGLDSWREFQQLIRQVGPELSDALQTPGDLVDLGLGRAKQEIEDYLAAVAGGREEMSELAVRSKLALNQVTDATEKLKASGHGMTDAQERELRELEAAYREATQEVGRFRRVQAEVQSDLTRSADKAGDYRAGVTSIEDALASLNPAMARSVGRLAAVTAGWTAGYSAGTRFLRFLQDVDRELGTNLHASLNRTVQELLFMQEAMDWFVGATPTVGQGISELNHIVKQLRAEGLEPVSGELEEVRQQLEAYRREQGKAAQATREADQRFREWREGIGLSEEALRGQAQELAGNLSRLLEEAGANADYRGFAERFMGEASRALEGIRITGGEVPEGLHDSIAELFDRLKEQARAESEELGGELSDETKKIFAGMLSNLGSLPEEIKSLVVLAAGEFGILPDALKTAVDGVEQQALRYENKIRQMAGLLENLEEPREQLAALEQALANLDVDELAAGLADGTEAQAREVRDELEKHVNQVRQLGGEYTENIQALSAVLGLHIAPWGDIRDAASGATEAVAEHTRRTEDQGDAWADVEKEGAKLADAHRQQREEAQASAQQAIETKDAYEEQASGAEESAEKVEKNTEALAGHAAAGEQAAEASKSLREEQESLVETSDKAATSLEQSGGKVQAYADLWSNAATVVGESVTAIEGHLSRLNTTMGTEMASIELKLDSLLAKFDQLRGSENEAPAAPPTETVN